MAWPCHEERGRSNADSCNDVKDEGKETKRKTKTKVARQHRQPPERKEQHISERSHWNEMFRESKRLEDIDFLFD